MHVQDAHVLNMHVLTFCEKGFKDKTHQAMTGYGKGGTNDKSQTNVSLLKPFV